MLAPDKILALDIGASTVKVGEFQASKTHGLRLNNFNRADLGIDPEHEENRKALIVSTIRNVLRKEHSHQEGHLQRFGTVGLHALRETTACG